MQRSVHEYLKALEAGDADRAAALFISDGWVESPFLGRLPVRQYVRKVADASRGTKLTVHDVLVSAEGHLRAVAYYQYDWRLKDGSRVSFDCADVFNFDPSTGHIQSIVLVYDTHPVRAVVENKYPCEIRVVPLLPRRPCELEARVAKIGSERERHAGIQQVQLLVAQLSQV